MRNTYRIKLEKLVDGKWEDMIVDTVALDDSNDLVSGRFQEFEKNVRNFIRSLNK